MDGWFDELSLLVCTVVPLLSLAEALLARLGVWDRVRDACEACKSAVAPAPKAAEIIFTDADEAEAAALREHGFEPCTHTRSSSASLHASARSAGDCLAREER